MPQFDYVIVGAGSAGCLLANRLSADPGKRVLLIEAGGKDSHPWIHVPVGYLYCIGNPAMDWLYKTEPQPGLNGRSLNYPRGKTLGGCSSINGMIYMRGQARDYDTWARLTGDDEWNWEHCLPDFMAHENHYRLDSDQLDSKARKHFATTHGHGGEWRIEAQRHKWDILEAFADAANQAGLESVDDFNSGDNEGVGYFEVNQRSGWRWNTAKAFLQPVKHRKNLSVWTNALVDGLCFEKNADGKNRCVGVRVRKSGSVVTASAKCEVVLAAGSIGSVQLLQLAGIGAADHLAANGIDVLVDAPGVGENLQDHLQIRAMFKIRGALTLNRLASTLRGKASIALQYLLHRSGPMSMAPSQLGAFMRSDPSQPHANLEFHVQPLSLDAFGEPLHTFDAFTASVCNLNPSSRGYVRVQSNRVDEAPIISPNYLATDDDKRVAAASIGKVREIVAQPALKPYHPDEFKPGKQFQTDAELIAKAGDIGSTIFHPVGTVKMGQASDPLTVLDSHLRVRGVDALRVVDASVMPVITSGNTNSPTLMIAEKASRWIIGGD